jgi:hypothetical protein
MEERLWGWDGITLKKFICIFRIFIVLFFNLACFKSIRTSKNHVRKGRKKQSKVKSQVCLQKEKKESRKI